jgi:cell division protein FtsB
MNTIASSRARTERRGRRSVRLTPAGAVLALVVVVLLFALAVPVRTLMQQRADLARLQRGEQVLEQHNDALKLQIARLHDPVYLERIARECLGMVRPGEIPFVVVPKAGAGSGGNGAGDGSEAFDPAHTSGC